MGDGRPTLEISWLLQRASHVDHDYILNRGYATVYSVCLWYMPWDVSLYNPLYNVPNTTYIINRGYATVYSVYTWHIPRVCHAYTEYTVA